MSWIETWYLFVELNGISKIFLWVAWNCSIFPSISSMQRRMADSEASPFTTLFSINVFLITVLRFDITVALPLGYWNFFLVGKEFGSATKAGNS